MANHILAAVGVRSFERVLPPELCAELAVAMRESPAKRAEVYNTGVNHVDEEVRDTLVVQVSEALRAAVEAAVEAVRTRVEESYGLELAPLSDFEFLRYGKGGRFVAHRDRPEHDPSIPSSDRILLREVSVVVFVNGQSETEALGTYCGGELLFRLFEDERDELRNLGFSTDQPVGSMITFPADLKHEVSEVTAGERFTVVGWFRRA